MEAHHRAFNDWSVSRIEVVKVYIPALYKGISIILPHSSLILGPTVRVGPNLPP